MRMVVFMGCGGSRADAVDPRWHESWTGETESTWLTTTDTEVTQMAIGSYNSSHQSGTNDPRASGGRKENTATCTGLGVSTSTEQDNPTSASKGSSGKERKLVNAGTQCGRQTFHCATSSNDLQRPTHEAKTKSRTSSIKAIKNTGQAITKKKIP